MRRGFWEDLAFFPQDPILPPESTQLLLFVTGQSIVPLARVQIRLPLA